MQRLSAIAPAQKRDSAIGCRRPFRPAFGRISFPFPTLLWQMPKHHHRPAPSTATMRMRRHQPCLLHESNMDKSASPYGTRGLKVRTAKVATLSWPRSLVPTRTGPSTSERPACSRKTSWRLLMLFPERTKLSRTDWSLPTNRTSLRWCTVEWKRLSADQPPSRLPFGDQRTRQVMFTRHRRRFRRLHHDPHTGSPSISGNHSPADRSLKPRASAETQSATAQTIHMHAIASDTVCGPCPAIALWFPFHQHSTLVSSFYSPLSSWKITTVCTNCSPPIALHDIRRQRNSMTCCNGRSNTSTWTHLQRKKSRTTESCFRDPGSAFSMTTLRIALDAPDESCLSFGQPALPRFTSLRGTRRARYGPIHARLFIDRPQPRATAIAHSPTPE